MERSLSNGSPQRCPASIEFVELATQPNWLSAVVQWQHQEWCRTRPDAMPAPSLTEQAEALEKRAQLLNTHLCRDTIPLTLLAIEEDRPLGSVSLVYLSPKDEQNQCAWVSNLFVVAVKRRLGIASQLLSEIENKSRKLRLKELKLATSDALEYYLKRHWQLKDQKKMDGEQLYILHKHLTP